MTTSVGPALVVFGILLAIALIGLLWSSRTAARLNPSSAMPPSGMRTSAMPTSGMPYSAMPISGPPAFGRALTGRGADIPRR
jgi:hypothetical protein